VAIALLGFALYAAALDAPFYYDDYQNIVDNPRVRWTEVSADKVLATALVAPTKRPVANLSFALSYRATGPEPAGFRAVNVLIHVACAIAVALLARALLVQLPRPPSPRDTSAMALFAGLLFVAHPLQIQSVTYVVQRMNALAGLFYVCALLAWLRGRVRPPGSARMGWWSLAAALGALSLGSKEMAVTLPVAIWLIEWFFLRDLRRFALRSALFAGVPLIGLAIWLYAAVLPEIGLGYQGRAFGAVERLLTELRVVNFYAGLALLPLPSRLNLLHDFALSRSLVDPITTLLSALSLLGSFGLAAYWARRAPLASFAILWFWLHLFVESFGLPLALAYEHRTYLPLAGPAMAAGWALFALSGGSRRRALALGLGAVASLGLATLVRNHVWDDELRLWADVAAKSPGLVAARNNHALALLRAGKHEPAMREFRAALEIDPDDAEAHNNLGNLQLGAGDPNSAIASFQAALRASPGHVGARHNLGIALAEGGNLEGAMQELEAALVRAPQHAQIWNTLGAMRVRLQDLEGAEEAFINAVRLDPGYTEARNNLRSIQRMRANRAKADGPTADGADDSQ
jgi:tetratricopeptide (TPR) repeat protein